MEAYDPKKDYCTMAPDKIRWGMTWYDLSG